MVDIVEPIVTTQETVTGLTNQDTQAQADVAAKAAAEVAAKEAETKAAEEAAKADEAKPKPEDAPAALDVKVWGDTGTASGNEVLQVLQESGIATEVAKALLYDAVQTGDPSKIDKAALVKELGEAQANIVMRGIDNFIKEGNDANNAVLAAMHVSVGGEANWDILRTWAIASLSESEIDDYIGMIDAGGRQATLAAKDLNARYEEAGNTSLVQTTVVPNASGPRGETLTPLTSRQYFDACEKASKTGTLNEATRLALLKGREAGKKAGI